MKQLLLILSWFPLTLATIFVSVDFYQHLERTRNLQALVSIQTHKVLSSPTPFLAYAALPQTTKTIQTAIRIGDARPVTINLYLEKFHSPLSGYGQLIVDTAEKYDVDPYLFIAIAQQESNLGKKMPTNDCHNAWGYGIHSKGTLCFSSWEESIETVMKGLSKKFLERGLTEPDEIMKKYTPYSNGSWANGVEQFIGELTTGDF